jgi:spore maturation protein CgeB
MSHSEKARKIASRGFTKLRRHHTTEARAKEFLLLVDKYL